MEMSFSSRFVLHFLLPLPSHFFRMNAFGNTVFQQALQINSHYNSSLKPEMTIEKLQKIATSQVEGVHKAKWLRWWNSSSMRRAAYRFLPPNFKEANLDFWLNKAMFWAQVVMNLKLWTLKFICRSPMCL